MTRSSCQSRQRGPRNLRSGKPLTSMREPYQKRVVSAGWQRTEGGLTARFIERQKMPITEISVQLDADLELKQRLENNLLVHLAGGTSGWPETGMRCAWQSPPVLQTEEDKGFRDYQVYRNALMSKAATKMSVHHCMWLSNQWSFQGYAMSPPCLCVAGAVSQTYAPWVPCKRIIPVWRRIFTIDQVSLWSTVCITCHQSLMTFSQVTSLKQTQLRILEVKSCAYCSCSPTLHLKISQRQ